MKTPINREDIRKGDLIRKEANEEAHEWRATADGAHWQSTKNSTFYLLDRPAPPLPTTLGSLVLAEYAETKVRAFLVKDPTTHDAPWMVAEPRSYYWLSSEDLTLISIIHDAGVDAGATANSPVKSAIKSSSTLKPIGIFPTSRS